MTSYSPSYYQPSVLELARQGNFQAIGYWLNSILAPQGIHIQTDTSRSGCLMMMINFPRKTHPQACIKARQRLVRHICYRLWTLNSKAIREVRIMARVTGQQEVIWRQSVRIRSIANTPQRRQRQTAVPQNRAKSSHRPQDRFQLLRSFLLNRLAIVGFLFCYWVIYLETTGQQSAEQPSVAATPQEQVQNAQPASGPEKTTIAHSRAQPPNMVFTVPPQFQGQIVHEVTPPATAEKVVALTFDDGPWRQTTEQILDILKQNNIKSTFYLVGQAIQENPTIARKVYEEGHAIGNHTWQHIMDDMDAATAARELGNTARLIYEATGGVRTYLMRPPGGNLTGELANYAKQQGYMVNMWSADSHDYLVSAPLIVDNVLSQVKPGGIVLLHDGGGDRTATVEALPQIISGLRSQGYKFVTVPELLELQAKWMAEKPITPVPDSTADTVPTLESSPAAVPPVDRPPASETSPTFEPQPMELPSTVPTETQPGVTPGFPITPASPNVDLPASPTVPAQQEHGAMPAPPSPLMQDAGAMPVAPEETAVGYVP